VSHPFGYQPHQDVVVHPVEEFLQVDVHDPTVVRRDVLLLPGGLLPPVALDISTAAPAAVCSCPQTIGPGSWASAPSGRDHGPRNSYHRSPLLPCCVQLAPVPCARCLAQNCFH